MTIHNTAVSKVKKSRLHIIPGGNSWNAFQQCREVYSHVKILTGVHTSHHLVLPTGIQTSVNKTFIQELLVKYAVPRSSLITTTVGQQEVIRVSGDHI